MNERTQCRATESRQGFTVIELIISVAVIAVLIGLISIGVRALYRRAGSMLDSSAVEQVYTGVKQFKQEVGFLPPVVKEFAGVNYEQAVVRQAPIDWPSVVVVAPPQGTDPARNKLVVYTRGSDAEFFKGNSGDYEGPTTTNFLHDNRFSQVTLGYYLAGQLEYAFNTTVTDVPIDGVTGPGMYKPEKGGFFDVPGSMRRSDPADRKRQGKTYGPYVESGGKSVKVQTDTTRDSVGRDVTVRDRNGIPIRYYYWLPSAQTTDPDPDRNVLAPRMVFRLPDDATHSLGDPVVPDHLNPKVNIKLRNASWAVVAAGPDKVFGDEDIDYIAQTLGKSPPNGTPETQKMRLAAAADNVIRLGSED